MDNAFPMGVVDAFWQTDPHGISFGGSGLELTPRSMAKFGFLYLNNGTWDNQQLVSKDWVVLSTSSYSSVDSSVDYCYGWWTLFGPLWDRYGDSPKGIIEAGNVFTLELYVATKNFGQVSLEENIIVTKSGCEFLSNPQTTLICVD